MTPSKVKKRADTILARYPEAEFVRTDFGRGGKIVFCDDPVEEFVIYRPAWSGFKVLRSGPRKGQCVPTGESGSEEIGEVWGARL